jgi:energy-coupling factor transporter ATP-binding protein EcfA2
MQLFKRFNDVGVTVVIATHDVHLIEQFGRAARWTLGDGRVGRERPPRAMRSRRRAGYFARHAQTLVGSLGRIAAASVRALMTMAVIASRWRCRCS